MKKGEVENVCGNLFCSSNILSSSSCFPSACPSLTSFSWFVSELLIYLNKKRWQKYKQKKPKTALWKCTLCAMMLTTDRNEAIIVQKLQLYLRPTHQHQFTEPLRTQKTKRAKGKESQRQSETQPCFPISMQRKSLPTTTAEAK